jgi:hypothetical protein
MDYSPSPEALPVDSPALPEGSTAEAYKHMGLHVKDEKVRAVCPLARLERHHQSDRPSSTSSSPKGQECR